MPTALTPEQSKARIAELRAQGYDVSIETLPDGTQVIRKSKTGDWLMYTAIGLALCFIVGGSARSRR